MENLNSQSENKKFKCPYCDKKIKTLGFLKKHIFTIHFKYDYTCPYCNESFRNLKKLQAHLIFKNDKFHRNLFHLITRKHIRFVDKKLFLDN
jgi:DNA-directed RNA polymerase subunit RPC12/RpoP